VATLLEKINALIARTASPEKEEARTSAFIACKLIRENKIELHEPRALPPFSGWDGWHPSSPAGPPPHDAWIKEQARRERAHRKAQAEAVRRSQRRKPKPKDVDLDTCFCGHKENQHGNSPWRRHDGGCAHAGCDCLSYSAPLKIKAKFGSHCIRCSREVRQNDVVLWWKTKGVAHLRCDPVVDDDEYPF
jgi:hypothetical protein